MPKLAYPDAPKCQWRQSGGIILDQKTDFKLKQALATRLRTDQNSKITEIDLAFIDRPK